MFVIIQFQENSDQPMVIGQGIRDQGSLGLGKLGATGLAEKGGGSFNTPTIYTVSSRKLSTTFAAGATPNPPDTNSY